MSYKIYALMSCLVTINAYYLPLDNFKDIWKSQQQPVPHYSYSYGVADPHTGDVKSQQETRIGDRVKGFYTLNEADGTKRIVHYTADGHHGFNAHVERIGHAVHPEGLISKKGYWSFTPDYDFDEPFKYFRHH